MSSPPNGPAGNGSVTLIGFDPTAKWLADGTGAENLWRRVLPARSTSGLVLFDDSQLVGAVSQLPALALPPIGGLIALLIAYIALIGPINYLVLRRLDRREWAWVTMPVLIVVFAVGAYGFGAALRGSDVLVNEVALVRGSPGATDGTAQVYLGVFSPSRGSYQVSVPGGALLSSPINGEFFGGDSTAGTLDVLQGDPAKVRDLAVGFGSLRTIRAETPVSVPMITANLSIVDGRLKGTIANGSQVTLEKPAVVLGGTVAVLADLAPGATQTIDTPLVAGQFGQPLSDKVVGAIFNDPSQFNGTTSDLYIRHTIVDQLTYDPNFGSTGQLATDSAVILAWGSGSLLPVEIAGQVPRATGNVLYYLPAHVTIQGKTTFRGDLITLHDDRHRLAVLRQGSGQHQHRTRPGHRLVQAHRLRWHADADRARVRAQLRRRPVAGHGRPAADRAPGRHPRGLSGPADRRLRGSRPGRAARGRALRPRER